MGLLFETLEKKQKRTNFFDSDEVSFYNENRVLLASISLYQRYLKAEEPFDIVRANIVIRAIINKRRIEAAFANKTKSFSGSEENSTSLSEYMANVMSELPFARSDRGEKKIYVPIFSYNLNSIYDGEFEKFLIPPYLSLLQNFEAVCIDPFDYYGPAIYDSHFTKFILVSSRNGVYAFYDFDSEAVYFVNKQGRLDSRICLFDRYIEHPDHNHMLNRIAPVIEAYFSMDLKGLEDALVENRLVSSRLIENIRNKRNKKLEKAYGSGRKGK